MLKKYRIYPRIMPFYYFVFASNAVYLGYFTVYLNSVGLSSSEIGIVMALAPLSSLLGQPLWSLLERRLKYKKNLIYLLSLGAAASMYLCGKISGIFAIGFFNCCYSIFYYSIQPVGDAVVLDELSRHDLPYGLARIAGVAGYASFSVISGYLIGGRTQSVTRITAIVLACITLVALLIPRREASSRTAAQKRTENLFGLLKDRSFLVLLLYGGAIMLSLTFYYNFFSLYFTQVAKGSQELLGFCYMISSMSELPFFFLGDRFIHKFGAGKVLLTGGILMALRWLLISLFPTVPVLMGTQFMHFACFAAMTVTIIEYVNSKAPASLKVSGQLLFSVFILSSARVLSSLIGGFLSKAFGYRGMYLFSSVFVLVVWAAFALYQKITKESYQL